MSAGAALAGAALEGKSDVRMGIHAGGLAGAVYFAMDFYVGFSVRVEMLDIRMRTRRVAPVRLHRQGPAE
ncbi:MAG: hypothetical protein WBG92_11535 [Thiohalocapsa sp.]